MNSVVSRREAVGQLQDAQVLLGLQQLERVGLVAGRDDDLGEDGLDRLGRLASVMMRFAAITPP